MFHSDYELKQELKKVEHETTRIVRDLNRVELGGTFGFIIERAIDKFWLGPLLVEL